MSVRNLQNEAAAAPADMRHAAVSFLSQDDVKIPSELSEMRGSSMLRSFSISLGRIAGIGENGKCRNIFTRSGSSDDSARAAKLKEEDCDTTPKGRQHGGTRRGKCHPQIRLALSLGRSGCAPRRHSSRRIARSSDL